ncbi:hypothetical protein [Devriesea agamarum]|uniref:hypothetical protein n=1 Tax=Devriesea agamarum TaxID=472569 RepID=UPI000B244E9C
MFRLISTLSVRVRDYLHRYMPSNRLLADIRTRRGLKWGISAMLIAPPYFLITSICSGSVAPAGSTSSCCGLLERADAKTGFQRWAGVLKPLRRSTQLEALEHLKSLGVSVVRDRRFSSSAMRACR